MSRQQSPGSKRHSAPTLLDPRRDKTGSVLSLLNPGGALPSLTLAASGALAASGKAHPPSLTRGAGGLNTSPVADLLDPGGALSLLEVLTPLDPDGALPLLDQGERHGTPSFLVRRIKRCEIWI